MATNEVDYLKKNNAMLECEKINFGFNRCNARKSNTSVIAVVCFMTLFYLQSVDDHKIKAMKEETYFGP